jgi:hypothetical protein
MRKSYWSLVVVVGLAAVLYFASVSVLILKMQPPLTSSMDVSGKTPTVNILLYEGEIGDHYGFGNSPDTLSSPGPTLRFKTTDIVNITVVNIGRTPHAFAITTAPRTGATTLFNAAIGSATNALQPGQSGTIIFSANNAGSAFFYICPVAGNAEAGMFGAVVIKTVPDGNKAGMFGM